MNILMEQSSKNDRQHLMNKIAAVYDEFWSNGDSCVIEGILLKHGASQDDSGEEGYFTGISDKDLSLVYDEIRQYVERNAKDVDWAEAHYGVMSLLGLTMPRRRFKLIGKSAELRDKYNTIYDKYVSGNYTAYDEGYLDAIADFIDD